MAKEYHDSDFKHEEIFAEAQELLSQQARVTVLSSLHCACAQCLPCLQALLASQLKTPQVDEFPAENWEKFHATHSSAKFFKARHYIVLAFPEVLQPNIHILEIGCGCGAAIVPTMKVRPVNDMKACCGWYYCNVRRDGAGKPYLYSYGL